MLKVISKNIIGIEAADVSNFLINGFRLTWGDNCRDATSTPQTPTDRWVGLLVGIRFSIFLYSVLAEKCKMRERAYLLEKRSNKFDE